MILFPAIDILGGKCVRLTQGDYNKETIYNDNPVEVAKEWERQGAEYIHIVDLDGAKTGKSINQGLIAEIAQTVSIPIQVGGGIRSIEVIENYLNREVSRVIIGTAAIQNPEFLREAVEKFGERIAVSIDARNGFVATDGWTKESTVKALDLVKDLEEVGVQTIVYTDILKDGMLQGPNFEELQAVNQATTIDVIASGGVTTEEDVKRLREQKMYGAIIGKALYDGTLNFKNLMDGEKMEKKNIIACLDVKNGRVVKGQQFQNIQEVADPVELAKQYNNDQVDELVLYDITASVEKRNVFIDLVENIAKVIQVPFTVGGGISSIADIEKVLQAGADKVSINSAAIENPDLISEASQKYGSETIVFALDAKEVAPGKWNVFSKGGQVDTGIDAIEWAIKGVALGAGEVVVNAIDDDGAKSGYNIALTKKIAEAVDVPVIASGGAGKPEHFKEALTEGSAAGALAASVFHFGEIKIPALKEYLANENVLVRGIKE